jgi:hypothetical protein
VSRKDQHELDVLCGHAAGLLVPNALGLHAHAAIGAADIGHAFYKQRIAPAYDR